MSQTNAAQAPHFTPLPETTLHDRVLTALQDHPYLARRNLRFENHSGRVVLRGTVGTYYQKQLAQEALRHIDGVFQITNELEVNWT
jgi:osmotically-inducible protein OsmY